MKSRRTMMYAVAAVTLLLAGCNGGDEDPSATPTGNNGTSSSTSATGSTSPTGSGNTTPSPSESVTLPSAARANSAEGAVAFVDFFLTDLDRAREQGDSSGLRGMGAPTCTFCSDYAEFLDGDVEKGLHTKDARTQIDLIEAESFDSKAAKIRVLAIDHASELVDKSGKVARQVPQTPLSLLAELSWSSGSWRVQEIEVQ